MSTTFKDSEFVYTSGGNGEIKAGGYTVKSFLKDSELMKTIDNDNNNQQKGGSSLELALNNLAVPAGLFYLQQNLKANSEPIRVLNKKNKKTNKSSKANYECENVISESLFDNLLAMVEPGERKIVDIKTRKRRRKKAKQTRKNRKK